MEYMERHPMIMIVIGIMGISLSAIFVKYSQAPSAVTAAYRLLWTVILMSPVVWGSEQKREELFHTDRKTAALCAASGIFLAVHFCTWFESLKHTTVASSTAIVCTEVIWVALGYCVFLKGRLTKKAAAAIGITLAGSLLIACSDSGQGTGHLYGDILALLAAVAVACYTLMGRVARTTMSTTAYTYMLCPYSGHSYCGSGIFFKGIRYERCDRGPSAVRIFHDFRPQHFQLVPEVFLSCLCLGLKAVRAGGGRSFCRRTFWRDSGPDTDCRRDCDHRRSTFLLRN